MVTDTTRILIYLQKPSVINDKPIYINVHSNMGQK